MEFFNQAIDILKILVMALGAGLAVWGVILRRKKYCVCCAIRRKKREKNSTKFAKA